MTIARICMVPLCLAALMLKEVPHHYLLATAIFVLASLTDFLDGYLARKHNSTCALFDNDVDCCGGNGHIRHNLYRSKPAVYSCIIAGRGAKHGTFI